MRRTITRLLSALPQARLSVGLFLAAGALIYGATVAAKPLPVMPLDEVKPGMKGHAVTVFSGTQSDRFEIEVIDVVRDYMPGQAGIFFRSTDPRLEHSGIVAGMSGSPIFIDGKLVGALAYGYRFNKDPIGGITPIEKMLEVEKLPYRPEVFPRPRARRRSGSAAWADNMLGLGASPLPARRRADEADRSSGRSIAGMQSLDTPVTVSGLGRRATQFLGDELGLLPARGASAGKVGPKLAEKKKRWKPGDSVSVVYIAGDNSAAANGTVTWVGGKKNDRLLAFGHPMNRTGPAHLPFADAKVHVIIPSVERSMKIASPLQLRGVMIQDRQPAISLQAGLEPSMIPVHTTIRGADDRLAPRRYESYVAEDVDQTPSFVAALLLDAVDEANPDAVEITLETTHRIALETSEGPRNFELYEETFFPRGILRSLLTRSRAQALLSIALDNDFEVARIRSVEQDVVVHYGAPVEIIERVRLLDDEIRAGETLELEVEFSRPRGGRRSEVITLRVPDDAGGETIIVELAGGDWVRPYAAMPDKLDELLDNIALSYPSRSLVASIYRSAEGLSTHHGLLSNLPDSVLETLTPSGSTEKAVRFKRVARRVLTTPKLIEGEFRLELDVLPRRLDASSGS